MIPDRLPFGHAYLPRVPVPDEYESPRATYLVAQAEPAKTKKQAKTPSSAAIRLHFMSPLPPMNSTGLPNPIPVWRRR